MIIVIVIASIVYASMCEWTLHRDLMHKPFLGFRYPFETHALTHHRIFKADQTYHLKNEPDKEKIPMAWWSGPALAAGFSLPALLASWISGAWSIVITVFIVLFVYHRIYEYIHWCMHLPLVERRVVERSWLFYRLNGHHLLHHRYMGKNFNVVLPLADLLFGTLLLRSKIRFVQARGPSVPDVQPKQ